MYKILFIGLIISTQLFGLRVETSYSTLGAITKIIGGNSVKVNVLANPKYDPHFIVPKPSLIAKLRRADLLIINGAGLEIGWLPPLIRTANNGKIQVGREGLLDISHYIAMINVRTSVSRGFGEIHGKGNPHYTMDPHRVRIIAKAIAKKLIELDYENADKYQSNLDNFLKSWGIYLKKLDSKMATCKTKKVIQYHELFTYFLRRYKIKKVKNIEPLPGITPSSKHTLEVINTIKSNNIKVILQDVYHERKTAKFIASITGARVAIIPHEVDATDSANTLENFYTEIADNICQ